MESAILGLVPDSSVQERSTNYRRSNYWKARGLRVYHGSMATVHMSEAEVARDLHAVLAKVRQGVEVIIEQDHQPVAVLKPSQPVGRLISEIIADLEARGSTAVLDEGFMKDVQEGIDQRSKPWNPPSWE